MTYIITDYKSNVCLWQQYKLAFYVREIRGRCESVRKPWAGLGAVGLHTGIGVTAPSSLYKSEPSGLGGQTTPVSRRDNILRAQRPQTLSSYQFWCKAVCLLHVGWGPDVGYSVVLVFIVFLPAETSILLPGENFIIVA